MAGIGCERSLYRQLHGAWLWPGQQQRQAAQQAAGAQRGGRHRCCRRGAGACTWLSLLMPPAARTPGAYRLLP